MRHKAEMSNIAQGKIKWYVYQHQDQGPSALFLIQHEAKQCFNYYKEFYTNIIQRLTIKLTLDDSPSVSEPVRPFSMLKLQKQDLFQQFSFFLQVHNYTFGSITNCFDIAVLYEKYSTVFGFDPPMQNTLYVCIKTLLLY